MDERNEFHKFAAQPRVPEEFSDGEEDEKIIGVRKASESESRPSIMD